jgi:hypothetical protein
MWTFVGEYQNGLKARSEEKRIFPWEAGGDFPSRLNGELELDPDFYLTKVKRGNYPWLLFE